MMIETSIRENLDRIGDDRHPGYVQIEAQDHDEQDIPDKAFYVNLFARGLISGEAEIEDGEYGGVCLDITDLRIVEALAHTMLAVVERARRAGFPDRREELHVSGMTRA